MDGAVASQDAPSGEATLRNTAVQPPFRRKCERDEDAAANVRASPRVNLHPFSRPHAVLPFFLDRKDRLRYTF